MNVFEANQPVVEKLKEVGALMASRKDNPLLPPLLALQAAGDI